ncbi:hypothetical protein OIU85_023044 [Salix viminalis]|uniref:Glycine-rich protein n=1 Tax=Salix viminalis TaxID=40686 RepID=A0A9Q0Z8A4_SALVM|nr:hypothetical protein OIU85_023044 [Salix viminalis]
MMATRLVLLLLSALVIVMDARKLAMSKEGVLHGEKTSSSNYFPGVDSSAAFGHGAGFGGGYGKGKNGGGGGGGGGGEGVGVVKKVEDLALEVDLGLVLDLVMEEEEEVEVEVVAAAGVVIILVGDMVEELVVGLEGNCFTGSVIVASTYIFILHYLF